MDWLKDEKNRPIIAVAAAVVIIAVGVVIYMMASGGSDSSSDTTTTATTQSSPPSGDPFGTPAPSTPSTPDQVPGAEQVAMGPTESWRADPFLPFGYKPPKKNTKTVKLKPPIPDFPFPNFAPPPPDEEVAAEPEPPQPARRMAGILLNGRIYAIIETNGNSEIVQPGDMLSDRLAVVERIERDKVVLRSTSKSGRQFVVRMASAAKVSGGSGNAAKPSLVPGSTASAPKMFTGSVSPM